MSYSVVKTAVKPGRLDCYLLNLRPGNLIGFLGHDPRSANWKNLDPWQREIYEFKQRKTDKSRIDALEQYIEGRLMDGEKFGALPPISIIQFEALKPEQLSELARGCYLLDVDREEARRMLIDGLARVTAILAVRSRLEVQNRSAFDRLKEFEFSVALYVPATGVIGDNIAGQLFTDFNSYAWPVSAAKAVSDDVYNPYKIIADKVADFGRPSQASWREEGEPEFRCQRPGMDHRAGIGAVLQDRRRGLQRLWQTHQAREQAAGGRR